MHDVEELEERWKRYRRRKLLPWLLSFGLLLLLTLFALSFFPKRRIDLAKDQETKVNITHLTKLNTMSDSEQLPQRAKTIIATQKKTPQHSMEERSKRASLFLQPQTDFLITANQTAQQTHTSSPHQSQNEGAKKDRVLDKHASWRSSPKTTPATIQPPRHLTIQTKQTNHTLDYLIKKFNNTRNPNLAYYIAQSFFRKGRYKETIRWCVIANSIEPSNPQSWLLFAKSKVKLGKRLEAIQALNTYLSQYQSDKVLSYRNSLKAGL